MKRSRAIGLGLIASVSLAACAQETHQTSRARYATAEECERDWGDGADRCRREGNAFFSPYFLFLGGRGLFYPYAANGVAASRPLAAPLSATFSPGGQFVGSGRGTVVSAPGVRRGGFGGTARGVGAAGT